MAKKAPKGAKISPKKEPTFEEIVARTPEISICFQPGLQALGSYSTLIQPKVSSLVCGSVDLDKCVERIGNNKYAQANRWDYILCYDGKVYFVEVHSANTGEVSTVLNKLKWLKEWLNQQAPEIKSRLASQPYHWIQSNRFDIPKHSSQYRLLQQNGLMPKKNLTLPL